MCHSSLEYIQQQISAICLRLDTDIFISKDTKIKITEELSELVLKRSLILSSYEKLNKKE